MRYYSHGKLLITAEYSVLDGAKALAVPTRFGQSLEVSPLQEAELIWESLDEKGKPWFQGIFELRGNQVRIKKGTSTSIANRLEKILQEAGAMQPAQLFSGRGASIRTRLEFPSGWGLGTSSTLIHNIASWLDIDPYTLLQRTFGGSGYDIAAAGQASAFTFQLVSGSPSVLQCTFQPPFQEQLFFVYLNRKQNSREGIARYRSQKGKLEDLSQKISGLTQQMIRCETLKDFELLMEIHETLISKSISLPKIKSRLFNDYPGGIKSLGAWGGDFIMATGGDQERAYFRNKNYNTIVSYSDMVLQDEFRSLL